MTHSVPDDRAAVADVVLEPSAVRVRAAMQVEAWARGMATSGPS